MRVVVSFSCPILSLITSTETPLRSGIHFEYPFKAFVMVAQNDQKIATDRKKITIDVRKRWKKLARLEEGLLKTIRNFQSV